MSGSASVFVPATVGNVAAGFDVLGLAVEGLGDEVSIELVGGPSLVRSVTGRDAEHVPKDPRANCAVIAAESVLRRVGDPRGVAVSFKRGLPISGGLGSSAASSIGGAYAAAVALGRPVDDATILAAALDGEGLVAGRHLDNIAPAYYGGLCVVLGAEPPAVAPVPIVGEWWITLVSPSLKLETKTARAVLPTDVNRETFVAQLGYATGLVTAFARGDHGLARRCLVDLFAEPRRAPLIKGFAAVKAAALQAGALGASISGAGPTIFAVCDREDTAKSVAASMTLAFAPTTATAHVGRVARRGVKAGGKA